MSKHVRVSIVGMGTGRHNGKAIDADPRDEVVALCDLDEQRMDEFEKELGHPVRKYTDYKAMCHDANVDAVFVGTPNQLHVPVALAAVRRDKRWRFTQVQRRRPPRT